MKYRLVMGFKRWMGGEGGALKCDEKFETQEPNAGSEAMALKPWSWAEQSISS